jgi:serine phosphatase RsbU (regulator of sigma subunit)
MGTIEVTVRATDRTPLLEWGVAAALHPGQTMSGDLHGVFAREDGVLVAVLDGVGHGEEAAAAAQIAAATLERHPEESVISLARRCHAALVGTRGVAMSLATFNAADDTMTWLAIGNVEGVLVRSHSNTGSAREAIVMRGGVIGARLPPLQATVVPVSRDDMLVFATDGVRSGFVERVDPAEAPQRLAERLLTGFAKGNDDALVLAARYLGRPASGSP